MRVSGAALVHAPAEAVWAALGDRDVVLRAIPGIERLALTGNGRCEFTVRAAIAAISGTYTGETVVRQADAPSRLGLTISAAGARGTINCDVDVRLVPASDEVTEVSYEADAEAAGPIAGIGQRMLASIVKRQAGDFIANLDEVLTGPPAAPRPAASAEGPAPSRASAEVPARSRESAERAASIAVLPDAESVIERAQHGIGLRRQPVPPRNQAGAMVRTALLAGAAGGPPRGLVGAPLGPRPPAPARARPRL